MNNNYRRDDDEKVLLGTNLAVGGQRIQCCGLEVAAVVSVLLAEKRDRVAPRRRAGPVVLQE